LPVVPAIIQQTIPDKSKTTKLILFISLFFPFHGMGVEFKNGLGFGIMIKQSVQRQTMIPLFKNVGAPVMFTLFELI